MVIGVMTMVMGFVIEILKMEIENVDADAELFLVSSEGGGGSVNGRGGGYGSDYISSPS